MISISSIEEIKYLNFIKKNQIEIKNKFKKYLEHLINETDEYCDLPFRDIFSNLNRFVIYHALDGSRSTITKSPYFPKIYDVPFFLLQFLEIQKSVGIKKSIFIPHTTYNRGRGQEYVELLMNIIKHGLPLIKEYAMDNEIKVVCPCINKNYELINLINDVGEKTRENTTFTVFILTDYNEEWCLTREGKKIIDSLPDINVHIRHTKHNFSGGIIPNKMIESSFIYCQNGSVLSNWSVDEMIILLASSVYCYYLNKGEGLIKIYSEDELRYRYIKREKELFHKRIFFKDEYNKYLHFGSPLGIYEVYF